MGEDLLALGATSLFLLLLFDTPGLFFFLFASTFGGLTLFDLFLGGAFVGLAGEYLLEDEAKTARTSGQTRSLIRV